MNEESDFNTNVLGFTGSGYHNQHRRGYNNSNKEGRKEGRKSFISSVKRTLRQRTVRIGKLTKPILTTLVRRGRR